MFDGAFSDLLYITFNNESFKNESFCAYPWYNCYYWHCINLKLIASFSFQFFMVDGVYLLTAHHFFAANLERRCALMCRLWCVAHHPRSKLPLKIFVVKVASCRKMDIVLYGYAYPLALQAAFDPNESRGIVRQDIVHQVCSASQNKLCSFNAR